jgi:hypothetical protein
VAAFAPAVSVPGWNRTTTVQFAFGASVGWRAEVHVVPADWMAKSVDAPVVVVTVAVVTPVSVTFPVLVNVKIDVGPLVVAPRAVFGKVPGLGDQAPFGAAATEVPVSVTGEPAIVPELELTATLPVEVPAVPGGALNTTLIVQLVPPASVVLHVPPAVPVGRENGPVNVVPMLFTGRLPVLFSVSGWDALDVPAGTPVYVNEVGETFAPKVGGPDPASTAPAST